MFRELLTMPSDKLYDFLVKKLQNYYYSSEIKYQEEDKLYIAAKGDIPIVLVAHIDTVFKDETREDMRVYCDQNYHVWWSPDGLGADDRVGIMMILQILKQCPRRLPHILFTMGEEIDARGAFAAISLKENFYESISYVIELDRAGYKEAVYYDCNNKEFEEFINSFGFDTHKGIFTDISILCPEWGVAGVNLSVGYYCEHSYMEYFMETAWKYTFYRVLQILGTKYDKIWKYIPKGDNK